VHNPFIKGSRERSLATEISKLHGRRADLSKRLAEHRAVVQQKQANVEQMLIDDAAGDILAKAENLVAEAERHERSVIGAVGKLDEQIADREAKLAAVQDEKQRAQTITLIEEHIDDLNSASIALVEGARRYADASGGIVPIVFEMHGLSILAQHLVAEIPTATAQIASHLRNHIKQVRNKAAPAILRQPEPTASKQVVPAPTKRVYLIRGVYWRDQENPAFTQTRPRFSQVDLPVELAERAQARHAAIEIDDPRVAELSRGNSPKHAPKEESISLDDNPVEPAAEPEQRREELIKHSALNTGRGFLGA
jgi:hypothetical protein